MPKHFWFKFEWEKWRNDPQLRRCCKETRGFWIDCIAAMEELDTYFLEGTKEEICRDIVATSEEFDRSIAELVRTKAASISKSKGRVKIVSRKILKGVSLTEYNRLKQQESRARKRVKKKSSPPSKIRVLDKKELREEEELREGTAPPPEPETIADGEPTIQVVDARRSHPAIVALHDLTGIYPPKEIWDEVIDRLGFEIDHVKLQDCYRKWRARGYNKTNYDGFIDWYHDGIPQQGKQNGKSNKSYREQRSDEAKQSYERVAEIRRRVEERDQQLPRTALPDSGCQLQLVESNANGHRESGTG